MNQDLFVAAIACLLGASSLLAGIMNWEWCFQLRKAQWVETRWGRKGARLFFSALGLVLILLGIAIGVSGQLRRRQESSVGRVFAIGRLSF
ncbi:MAG: Imm17 family immunity protein [Pirellulaceae bacterium]|nr:Imm17 family immunity protein [Pirellulaceae bacterium]MDP7014638.1 Imm17 family immunity protein [Pirellulaceae bacterium]